MTARDALSPLDRSEVKEETVSDKEAADAVAEMTGADVVQVIGSKFVLFKRNEKEPKIELVSERKKKK